MSTTAHTLWHLGSMNDGLFIINTPPSPAGTDVGPWDNPNGPTMVLNITDLPVGKAQQIVDAHNVAVKSHDALTARIAEQEKRIDVMKAALEPFVLVEERDIGEDETDVDLFKPMLSNNSAPRLVVGDFRRARAALTEGEGA